MGAEYPEATTIILDENVERVRKARQRLVARYGGLQGLIRHLQAMDWRRQRSRKPGPERRTRLQKSKISPAH